MKLRNQQKNFTGINLHITPEAMERLEKFGLSSGYAKARKALAGIQQTGIITIISTKDSPYGQIAQLKLEPEGFYKKAKNIISGKKMGLIPEFNLLTPDKVYDYIINMTKKIYGLKK
jgi:hypothetical protein